MSSHEETKNIRAVMIFDIIGKPPEHLTKTLNNLITKIDEEKGVCVKEKKINEPVLMEDSKNSPRNKEIKNTEPNSKKDSDSASQKEFYTSFAEVEVEVEDILYLVILMFKYMPAHIEVITPELIALTNNGWNDILNELTRRLHGYDEIARILQIENAKMQKKMREMLEGKE
jgi:hypothetical protein